MIIYDVFNSKGDYIGDYTLPQFAEEYEIDLKRLENAVLNRSEYKKYEFVEVDRALAVKDNVILTKFQWQATALVLFCKGMRRSPI